MNALQLTVVILANNPNNNNFDDQAHSQSISYHRIYNKGPTSNSSSGISTLQDRAKRILLGFKSWVQQLIFLS